jgi:hypothetical protein
MAARPNFFLVLSEMTVLLLGGLLIVLALTRTVGIPSSHAVLFILGGVLVYWALRAWMKKEPASARLQTHIRAGSIALVGVLMIAMPLLPLEDTNLLVIAAGIVLVVRGLLSGLFSLRRA